MHHSRAQGCGRDVRGYLWCTRGSERASTRRVAVRCASRSDCPAAPIGGRAPRQGEDGQSIFSSRCFPEHRGGKGHGEHRAAGDCRPQMMVAEPRSESALAASSLRRLSEGSFEAQCGKCLRFSLPVDGLGPEHAWSELVRGGWTWCWNPVRGSGFPCCLECLKAS